MKEKPLEFQFDPSVTLLKTFLAEFRSLVRVRRVMQMAIEATTVFLMLEI